MTEHIQRNRQGEAVAPNATRDMLHLMLCHETQKTLSRGCPQHFGAYTMAAAGVMDYDDAEKIFADLQARGYVRADAECVEAYVLTEDGRAKLERDFDDADLPECAWYEHQERERFVKLNALSEARRIVDGSEDAGIYD